MALIQHRTKEEIFEWVKEFLHSTNDSLSTTNFAKYYSKNATLTATNGRSVTGLETILKVFGPAWASLSSSKHNVLSVDVVGNKLFVECLVVYTVKNDPKNEIFEVPAFGIFVLRGGEGDGEEGEGVVQRSQVWYDAGEVWKRIREVGAMEVEAGVVEGAEK